ncbi:cardiolipin synthase [Pseudohalioglobus sediminis]|uniref:Cardiolipin synthase n=1 Tax=Pseudohalioglobus sediminis TaxID=2606449 RepID=A0A5B0WYA0_9GAMM|nr:cardiolipin synthase [Pseudohalioglobus sediminis]KAA1191966.1 cardiolipin synthase [Pseudohalioglobus sediminis]
MAIFLFVLLQLALAVRVLLRPHRDPASRVAWLVVILAVPVAGIIAYLLLGETSIGRRRVARMNKAMATIPDVSDIPGWDAEHLAPGLDELEEPLFRVGESISGYRAVGGNRGQLMADSNAAINAMIADIDAATDHVHLLFYIWMPDNSGTSMARALQRAVARGVCCRAMVDDIGSKLLIKSGLWEEMETAGIKLCRVLQVGNPLLHILQGRIDLRNHRKILVIDNRVTYCGSQNCADPEFLTKARYAPWVDVMVRFTGPIVRQNQHVFASDWMAYTNEDIRDTLLQALEAPEPGFPAQVIASGPTARYSAVPETFQTLIYSARRELFITTPYYVPVDSLQAAICAAANRGVDTTIIFPARNDDFAVGATSKSYYQDMLDAGVNIYEYQPGLLHAKTITVDGRTTLIGSANMDRRSFDLNYENNILLCDEHMTAAIRQRQQAFLADSLPVTAAQVTQWTLPQRLWHNALAIVGPVL